MKQDELLTALTVIHHDAITVLMKINQLSGQLSNNWNDRLSVYYFNQAMNAYADFLRNMAMAKENAKINQ